MAWASAIIAGLGALAQTGFTIANAVKGKDAKTGQIGVSGAGQAALNNQRYTADRLASLGGMSSASFNRMAAFQDIEAQQTQQSINDLATAPFQDSFQRESLAKLMLSRMFKERRTLTEQIGDIDYRQSTQNAFNIVNAQNMVYQSEAFAQQRRNEVIAANEQLKIDNYTNMARSLGPIAKAFGMAAEGFEKQIKYLNRNKSEAEVNNGTTLNVPGANAEPVNSTAASVQKANPNVVLNKMKGGPNYEYDAPLLRNFGEGAQ